MDAQRIRKKSASFYELHIATPNLLSSQNRRIQVLQDTGNIPAVKSTSLLSTLPPDTLDNENHLKRKAWANVKQKTSKKLTAAQAKPEVHEDDPETTGTGRKPTACYTIVLRDSRVESIFGFIEPDEPQKLYVSDFQKLYDGVVEFQPEEIAALRWHQDQKEKLEEKMITKLKGQMHSHCIDEKLAPKPEHKKPAFTIHIDERVENAPKNSPNDKSQERNRDVDEDFKENQATVGFVQRIPDKASPRNVLQITDRPIRFGEQEDEFDQEDDDFGVRPFPDEEFHTSTPFTTSQLHFNENIKASSTPCSKNMTSSCSSEQWFTLSIKTILSPTISMASPLDPFDPDLVMRLLSSVNIESRTGYIRMEGDLKKFRRDSTLVFGQQRLIVKSRLAAAGEGVIYRAETKGDSHWPRELVVKSYHLTNLWEFYICSEAQNRIDKVPALPYVRESLQTVLLAPVYHTRNLLIMQYCPLGNLLDLVNLYSTQNENIPECLSLYLTWEILQIVHQLHASRIIHADIKPDNFMVLSLPRKEDNFDFSETHCVRLIGFGQAIDRSMFPKGTTFNGSVKTKNFVCPEMLENKLWTLHTHYFGILGTVYTLLFREYMQIRKVKDKWGN